MITIYRDGRTAQIDAQSLPVWRNRGWSDTPPPATDTPLDLQEPVASTQLSDVTAPGESEIEGVEPIPEHAAQDEE